jgi:hypothetical protein
VTRRVRLARVALVPLLVVAAACGGGGGGKGGDDDPAVAPAHEGIDGVLAIRVTSAKHVLGEIDYDRHPPAGGDHNPTPAPCGFYDEVIPDEFVVHSLEHGAVWLAYSPTLAAVDLDAVKAVTADNTEVIATPYDGLDAGVAVVATAWARQLPLKSADDPRLQAFVKKYQNGKQAPEASIACPQRG